MLVHHSLFAAAIALAVPGPAGRMPAGGDARDGKGRIQVWTDNGTDPYRAGDHARVFMRGEEDAYVTVFRVYTDGRIQVLFPRAPWMDDQVSGGRDYEIEQTRNSTAFDVDDDPGVGYIFAVWSPDPFTYDAIVDGDHHWDYRAIGEGRIHGDPYVALTDLAGRILPDGDDSWDYDISPYYVDRRYDYPRFLCYDCHAYASFGAWDPYETTCPRFRIVAYDDPVYYPYRYYEGRAVVVNRPLRPEPRFVFKDRDGVGDDQFVTVTRDRSREGGSRGATGRDFGGAGRVPAPGRGVTPARRGETPEPPRQSPPPPPPRQQPKPSAEPRRAPQPAAKSPPPKEPAKGQPELRRRKP